ncbi:rolling circle replication-associated protein [Mycobacteroides sp. PCS013]|uniref:rolling circle replication-associated protein n=1 Tax=Mycobacteroides sp. PCS013 TaxID=3074106 RepID=UPI003C2F874B
MPSIAPSVTLDNPDRETTSGTRKPRQCRRDASAEAVDVGRSRAPEARRAVGRESVSGWPDGGSGAGPNPATAAGLVICAKNVRTQVSGDREARELRASDALGLRFPSPEMVASAAALFEKAAPWAAGRDRLGVEPESARFQITIGPGVVRLSWKNPVRQEKASERAVQQHNLGVAGWHDRVKDLLARASRLDPRPIIAVAEGNWIDIVQGRQGRLITEWSRKSRSMMCRAFAELDYTPLVESGRIPVMVTLTYPGDWEIVAPTGAAVKRHMVLWRKRFQREYGEPVRYIWKLEFQRRGAPHVHLWMAPPRSPGKTGTSFAAWLSDTWADIVDHPDHEQRSRHCQAGTAIDILSGLRACDPKRLAIYFTKHSSPNTHGDKEYQHIVPSLWREPGRGPGRFWGIYGLRKATATAEVGVDAYLATRRIIRRWSRSQAAYSAASERFPSAVVPRTAHRIVPRVDKATGRVKYRKVRRRRALCDQGGLAGGYALVNNGPTFAAQLSRAVA